MFWNFVVYLLENIFDMKSFIIALAMLALVVACGSQQQKSVAQPQIVQPTTYACKVKNVFPHSVDSYTQGLQFVDGFMWEGTGEYGSSQIVTYSLGDTEPKVLNKLPRSEFGEGITLLGERIYQLTWTSNRAYVYDRKSGKQIKTLRYTGEGWGLTTDGSKLFMTDGTSRLSTIDPETFRRTSAVTVTYNGNPVQLLNELEWIDGKIWANVYTTDNIVIIDPKTGVVEGIIDLEGLLPASEVTPSTDVLNGIAYDSVNKRIFVTGKNWSKLFEIKIIEQ